MTIEHRWCYINGRSTASGQEAPAHGAEAGKIGDSFGARRSRCGAGLLLEDGLTLHAGMPSSSYGLGDLRNGDFVRADCTRLSQPRSFGSTREYILPSGQSRQTPPRHLGHTGELRCTKTQASRELEVHGARFLRILDDRYSRRPM